MAKPNASDRTATQMQDWVRRDKNLWEIRNQRFERDQRLYELEKPQDSVAWSKNASNLLILNDPKVLIKKVSRILARHPNTIEVSPSRSNLNTVAQRVENFLYAWDQDINQQWMMGLHNPYRYDQAFYLTLRGWLCERTMLQPDQEIDPASPARLYSHRLFDPVDVYPRVSGDRIRRITHTYRARPEDLLEDPLFEDVSDKLRDMGDSTQLEVQACYWESEGSWYHAVLIDSEWAKKPTEIGYNPWTIVTAQGAAYRSTPWDDVNYSEHVGTGLLDDSAENYKYLDKIATKLNVLLSTEANPPAIIFSDGSVKKVDLTEGARNFLTLKDRVEVHRNGPNFGDFELLWNILTQRAERAGLPRQFFGEAAETGFNSSVVMSAGKDILFPFVEALNHADALKYRKVLELYRDFGPAQPLVARMMPDQLGVSERAEISAQDIVDQGTFIDVSRVDMTPQELIAKINAGLAAVREKAISLQTFRGKDWMGIRNPSKENLQILAEGVYLNPDVIKALTPMALSESGQQLLQAIWSATQNGMPQTGAPMQPGQPQLPQGQGQGQQPGMPGEVLPAVMQSGNLMETQQLPQDQAAMNQLLQLMTGGASGGMGGGGTPPPFGSTSPIPPFLAPGRLGG